MFGESRRKIVAAIMSILILLFWGTLAVIHGSSYYEVSESNREMLGRYVELSGQQGVSVCVLGAYDIGIDTDGDFRAAV